MPSAPIIFPEILRGSGGSAPGRADGAPHRSTRSAALAANAAAPSFPTFRKAAA